MLLLLICSHPRFRPRALRLIKEHAAVGGGDDGDGDEAEARSCSWGVKRESNNAEADADRGGF